MAEFYRKKRKICLMCAGKANIDYKDPETLKRYIATQVKRSRAIALMPYTR